MLRKIMVVFISFLIIMSLASCSKKGVDEKIIDDVVAPSSENTTLDKIIGLWESEAKEQPQTYEFLAKGLFIENNGIIFDYKFASDQTIAVTYDGQKVYKLLRLIDISKNTMVLEEDGKETKYKRVTPPENLRKNIVGLWEYDDGVITEFTTGGILLDSRLSNDEQVYYSILSDYTIALYHDSQKQDFFGFIGCISSGKDIMVLGRQGDEPDRELKKLPGHQNLATDILGLWKQDGDDENLLEFVNNGTYIQHLTNTINEYQVISDNSIIMDGQYVNVIKISKNELMVRQWDTEYFDEIVTFVK